jgi:hypothetical protein
MIDGKAVSDLPGGIHPKLSPSSWAAKKLPKSRAARALRQAFARKGRHTAALGFHFDRPVFWPTG